MIANWYDYPAYFDLAFRDETRDEANFLEAAFAKYCDFPVRRVLEPACGSGRLVVELATRGYRTAGFDLNEPMLAYARKRLERRGLNAPLWQADMAHFEVAKPFDAAFNTFNSFRHLLSQDAALTHLQCMARALKPGGLYILGLHLLPPDASEECTERWTAKQGATKLNATLKVIASNTRRRLETLRISMRVQTATKQLRLQSEFNLRLYSPRQIKHLLAKAAEFEVCDVFDFWYEIEHPLTLNDTMSDTVFVLRKRVAV